MNFPPLARQRWCLLTTWRTKVQAAVQLSFPKQRLREPSADRLSYLDVWPVGWVTAWGNEGGCVGLEMGDWQSEWVSLDGWMKDGWREGEWVWMRGIVNGWLAEWVCLELVGWEMDDTRVSDGGCVGLWMHDLWSECVTWVSKMDDRWVGESLGVWVSGCVMDVGRSI